MSSSFVSAGAVEGDSIALGTHQAGDVITILAYSTAGNTITAPAGFDNVSGSNFAGVLRNSAVGQFVATSGSEVSGTWTNATHVAYYVRRPTSGKYLITGNRNVIGTNNGTNMLSPVLTAARRSGRIVRMIAYDPPGATGYSAQADFTNRLTEVMANATIIIDDSDVNLATVSANNNTMSTAVRAHSQIFDFVEAGELSGGGGGGGGALHLGGLGQTGIGHF
jgi:hypothetical protein